jgi:hypothetical protein
LSPEGQQKLNNLLLKLMSYLKMLKDQFSVVTVTALTTYAREHGEGGAKRGGGNILSKALKKKEAKEAEEKRVKLCNAVSKLHEKLKTELKELNPNDRDSVKKWVGFE